MSENTIRHIISLCGTLVILLAWIAGYASGVRGWWWTIGPFVVVYAVLYALIEA